tara:strand:- start:3270 stop:3971 length:702 start_codon:yes stop_codon:yes gene_type:complete
MAGTLVLKQFQIDHTGVSGANLYVKARNAGLFAFILNLIGLDPTATVKVDTGSIEFRNSSLKGMTSVTTGLTSIAAFIGGYDKPISWLITGFLAFLGLSIAAFAGEDPMMGLFVTGLIVFLICIVIYAFQKVMYIGFETSGGATYMIAFKRSVIEGVAIDIARIEEAITLVNSLISSAASGKNVSSTQNVQNFGKEATLSYAKTPVIEEVTTQSANEHPGWKWDDVSQQWVPE